ncbi:hypothetical protein GWN26_12180, partial [Candidatus Saccharibacteria bacterium]|nr:protein BatD [Candidatus Saccharibacteria bacterium]NIV04225.1 hypothetical protein [Calditrichia bacterium]NIV72675.1 hypothetical protein [Calditrichia bacterium]NIV99833.1 hypothetical protein [Candidatus Saccharibacteria bacterium]NIW79494.1 hypothetical protein [Calditrichia bacterium]
MKRSKSNKTLLTILYLLLLIGLPLIGQDIKITATVNQNPVGVNDQFTYQVEISGSTQNLPDPQLPKLDDFRVVSGPNVSTSFQFINGAVSSSKTYT